MKRIILDEFGQNLSAKQTSLTIAEMNKLIDAGVVLPKSYWHCDLKEKREKSIQEQYDQEHNKSEK